MGSITLFTATLVWMLPETRGVGLGRALSSSRSPSESPTRGRSPERGEDLESDTKSNVVDADIPAEDTKGKVEDGNQVATAD